MLKYVILVGPKFLIVILFLVAVTFLKRSVVMHRIINFVESFVPNFVTANSTTLRPSSTWKDIEPNNLSLCRLHLSPASIINATATTLNMMPGESQSLGKSEGRWPQSIIFGSCVLSWVFLTQSLLGVAFMLQQQEWYLNHWNMDSEPINIPYTGHMSRHTRTHTDSKEQLWTHNNKS